MSGISSNSRRWGVALVSVVVLAGCGRNSADAAAEAAPAGVTIGVENIAVVSTATLSSGPVISGTLTPEREARVSAQISGPVMQTFADQGSRVAPGTILARIDDSTIRESFLSARSAVTTAQSAATQAARELERFTKLLAAGAVADRDLETARVNAESTESQLADARARLSIVEKQVNDAQVRAPFAGVVSERDVNAGDLVTPGKEMFVIVDPRSMRFEGAVPANELGAIRPGLPVSFTVQGYPGRTFEGKITRINPTADPTTGQVKVVVTVGNASNALVGGLFADGRVASETRTGFTAPYSAVDLRGVKPTVLRLTSGKADRVEVELGVRDEATERFEVLKGVAAGDTLLIGAAQGITPGTTVRVSVPSDRASAKS